MNDPYKTLGIPRDAPQEAVKQAYRRLAMELHPDRNPDNPRIADRFKDVNAAYGILGDAAKRARFDRGDIDAWGRRKPRPQRTQASAGSGKQASPKSPNRGTPKDSTENAKTKAREAGAATAGAANTGTRTDVPPRNPRRTEAKSATGRDSKKVASPNRWLGGGIKAEDLFGPLLGAGKAIKSQGSQGEEPAHRLRVSFDDAVRGVTRRVTVGRGRTLDVTVPPGIRDGQIIRLKGQGNNGPLGTRSDALVAIEVTPHKLFRVEGDDVHLEVPITLEEAVLGARVRVPTVSGSVEVNVPRGTNTGATLRLKGKGLKRAGGKASGDQLIRLAIKLPQGADPDLEDFVRRRKGRVAFDPREGFATL